MNSSGWLDESQKKGKQLLGILCTSVCQTYSATFQQLDSSLHRHLLLPGTLEATRTFRNHHGRKILDPRPSPTPLRCQKKNSCLFFWPVSSSIPRKLPLNPFFEKFSNPKASHFREGQMRAVQLRIKKQHAKKSIGRKAEC